MVLEFGSVHVSNFSGLSNIATVVQHSQEVGGERGVVSAASAQSTISWYCTHQECIIKLIAKGRDKQFLCGGVVQPHSQAFQGMKECHPLSGEAWGHSQMMDM